MDEELETKKSADPSIVVFLSLYLLLLAFFILLNSISQVKTERVKAAVGSVNATFTATVPTVKLPVPKRSVPGPIIAPDAFHTRIRKVFESNIPIARVKTLDSGKILQVTVPTDQIFVPNSIRLRDSREAVLTTLADALSDNGLGQLYNMEVLLGAGPKLPRNAGNGRSLPLNRAGALARELRGRGVPARSLSVGLREGDTGIIKLTFVERSATGAVSFDHLVDE